MARLRGKMPTGEGVIIAEFESFWGLRGSLSLLWAYGCLELEDYEAKASWIRVVSRCGLSCMLLVAMVLGKWGREGSWLVDFEGCSRWCLGVFGFLYMAM